MRQINPQIQFSDSCPVGTANQSAVIEDAPEKRILVLYGSGINPVSEQNYYDKLLEKNPCIIIEYQSLKSFAALPPEVNTKYDQIIIRGHGRFLNKDEKNKKQQRQLHEIKQDEARFIETAVLIKECAKYTKKILVSSCFACAVMKDLQADYSGLGEVEIVAITGSKYSSISYNYPALKMAEEFLSSENKSVLYQAALEHFPDTICVFYKGKFFKLGAVKIPGNKKGAPNPSAYAVAADSWPMRHYCEPRKKVGQGNGNISSWWEVKGEPIAVKIEDTSLEFKNGALAVSANNGHKYAVKYWLDSGADSAANINTDGYTAFTIAILNGWLDVVNILAEKQSEDQINKDLNGDTALVIAVLHNRCDFVEIIAEKLSAELINKAMKSGYTALMFAALRGHDDMVEILTKKLTAEQINQAGPGGVTAYSLASMKGHNKVIEIFNKRLESNRVGPIRVPPENKISPAQAPLMRGAEVALAVAPEVEQEAVASDDKIEIVLGRDSQQIAPHTQKILAAPRGTHLGAILRNAIGAATSYCSIS
jgi:hypothetical protein